jgi:hypothetical protein
VTHFSIITFVVGVVTCWFGTSIASVARISAACTRCVALAMVVVTGSRRAITITISCTTSARRRAIATVTTTRVVVTPSRTVVRTLTRNTPQRTRSRTHRDRHRAHARQHRRRVVYGTTNQSYTLTRFASPITIVVVATWRIVIISAAAATSIVCKHNAQLQMHTTHAFVLYRSPPPPPRSSVHTRTHHTIATHG